MSAKANENSGRGQLMHGVLTMSGTALEYWTLDGDYKQSLKTHGKKLRCYKEGEDKTPDEIVKCMKKKSIKQLIKASNEVGVSFYFMS